MVRSPLVVALALVLASLGCRSSRAPAQATAPAPQPSAAASSLPPTVDRGKLEAELAAQRGHPVLINILASWCAPCRQELPDIAELARAHPKLRVIGISVDENADDLRRFLPTIPPAVRLVRYPSSTGIAPLLPALHLPKDWYETMDEAHKGWPSEVPLTLVFDGKGEFQTGSVGQLEPAALQEIGRIAEAP